MMSVICHLENLVTILCLADPAVSPATLPNINMAEITAHWTARRDKRSFRVAWQQETVGDIRFLPDQRPPHHDAANTEFDVTQFTENVELWFWSDGVRMGVRYSGDIARRSGTILYYEHDNYTTLFDGTASKRLHQGLPGQPPAGFVVPSKVATPAVMLLDVKPLVWTHFLSDPVLTGWDPGNFIVRNSSAAIGYDCWICEAATGGLAITLWVDRGDHRVRRVYSENVIAKSAFQVDVDYVESDRLMLESWTITYFQDARTRCMKVAKNVVYEFDVRLSDEDFDIVFPPGAIVTDTRPEAGGDSDLGLNFIVRPDGTKRIITAAEVLSGASYTELMRTNTGELDRKPSVTPWRLPLIAIALGVVLVIVVYFAVKHRAG